MGEDYKGGRDFSAMQKFAKGLKPSCSPAKIELCDDDMKAKIKELQALFAGGLGQADQGDEVGQGGRWQGRALSLRCERASIRRVPAAFRCSSKSGCSKSSRVQLK